MSIAFDVAREVPSNADVLAVPVYQGREVPAGAPAELDMGFLAARGFDGKVGETLALLADDGTTILAVGVGPAETVTSDTIRRAAATAVKAAWHARRMATTLLTAAPADAQRDAAQALAEGAALGAYRFTSYKSENKPCLLETVTVVGRAGAAVQRALDRGATIAAATRLARDLVNEPPGKKTPRRLEAEARAIADQAGLAVSVLDEVDIENEGLGGLMGVAAGSDEPPRLIELVYDPPGARHTIGLVGKGITFDSGGLSLKTSEGMMTMKTDMSGAAAVLGVMSVLPTLAPKVKVVGIAVCTENMPSGKATKPGDVLKIRNGKTVEVLNTDAEGRLVLADGLSLAVEAGADAIIDIATLTGACVVALGREIAGVMGNNDDLVEQVTAAADRAGEAVWPLPLPARYRKQLDSDVADLRNIGSGGQGGSLLAGLFLKEFVADVPWVHLDIAGPARAENDDGYISKGGTGFAVRTILELIGSFRRPKA
jgi:leucyl aminopeptidase